MAGQPNQQPADAVRDDQPQKPADTGNKGGGNKGGNKISSETEKAQEEAAKDRAREGGYQ